MSFLYVIKSVFYDILVNFVVYSFGRVSGSASVFANLFWVAGRARFHGACCRTRRGPTRGFDSWPVPAMQLAPDRDTVYWVRDLVHCVKNDQLNVAGLKTVENTLMFLKLNS